MAYMLWSLVCVLRSTGINIGTITVLETATLASAFILARTIPNKAWILHCLTITGILQAVYAILLQYGVTESNHEIFQITGFMGNPGQLGGFQAIPLISSVLLYEQSDSRHKKRMLVTSSALILYSLILSDSRAGLLAATGGVTMATYKTWHKLTKITYER